MSKKKILYEGKAKTILEGPTPDTVIQYFKDDATANNAEKHSIINGKGVLNNSISDFLMNRINEIGIPTHYIKKLNMREQLVRKVEIIPVEFVVRNIAAGSIVKRLGLNGRLPDIKKLSRLFVGKVFGLQQNQYTIQLAVIYIYHKMHLC